MVDRSPKGLEYFDSSKEIISEQDRVELDIHITGWSKMLRIRALSFKQMEEINKASKTKDGTIDSELWTYHTIHQGVTRPSMKYSEVESLAESNGAIIRELADEIWALGRISKAVWDSFVNAQKELDKIQEEQEQNAER